MKKIILLAIAISLTMTTKAADVIIDGIFYNLSQDEKTAEVTSGNYTGVVNIPSSITFGGTAYCVNKIGSRAFYACKSLISVSIPESVTHIGEQAFLYCTKLATVNISNGVLSIGDYAFYGCKSLETISIPNSVTFIGDFAFESCSGLTSITISNSVTQIGAAAFRNCVSLTSITIPNSVNIISEEAFRGCTGLTSIVLGSGVTRIANFGFGSCSNLAVIYCMSKFPITASGDKSFMFYNTPIANATLYVPASLLEQYKTSVPWYGFGSIKPLDYIDGIYYNFYEDEAEVTYLDENYNSYSGDIVIPTSVTTVWGETYSVTGIGDYAFKNCNSLATITIPSSVRVLGTASFSGCSNLPSITIPQSITTIGMGAFEGCTKLSDVYCHATEVPNTESNTFDNSSIMSATLHIPNKSIHLYKRSSPWSNFSNFAGLYGNEYTLSYFLDGSEYKSYKLWEDEKIFCEEEPAKEGHTFSGWSEIPETMPAHDVTVTGTFSINSYKLTYMVDCEVYKTYEIEYGATITPETEPTKEGYTFSGWSEIPETMPAHDVNVTGTFSINKYKLTYIVDGEEYKSYEIDYGSIITAEVEPAKVGHTFSGWSEVPEKMPAHDVTVTGSFSVNSYTLTYMVDGEVYKTYEIEYGTAIIPEEAPSKTGYTFSGWGEIPSTMPAKDVTLNGTFTINNYKLIYVVDGVEYKIVEVEYNSPITPETEPKKEGYTFSGWSEIPEIMPANDVTVTGSFTVNTYTLTYMVDNEVYKTIEVDYGTTIIPETAPTKTGYSFSGWDDVPLTMPAKDVTVSGTFTINSYKLTYIVDGEEYKTFEITYDSAIIPEAEPTKEGHTFSGWSEIPVTMPAHDVTVTGSFIVNKYQITYIIDGEVFAIDYLEYGATIIPPTVEEREGFTFSGWEDLPETMPAHDVTVTGTFTLDTGIEQIMSNANGDVMIFTIDGKRVDNLKKGMNVIRMKDGTTRKVVVK